jgi:hypothetical protein
MRPLGWGSGLAAGSILPPIRLRRDGHVLLHDLRDYNLRDARIVE